MVSLLPYRSDTLSSSIVRRATGVPTLFLRSKRKGVRYKRFGLSDSKKSFVSLRDRFHFPPLLPSAYVSMGGQRPVSRQHPKEFCPT